MTDQPIIWKRENCLTGQCKGLRDKHAWSIPFSVPHGLVTECFHCHKTRKVEVEDATGELQEEFSN